MSGKIAIGRVRSSHGIRGELRIVSLSGETDHFLALDHAFLETNHTEVMRGIESVRMHGRDLLIKFAGIDSPEDGKRFAGCTVLTEREHACPLDEGEYYQADILGCTLFYRNEPVGEVIALVENGPKELLEVSTPGGNRLIPFVDEYIGEVRVMEKRIELKLDWLL